MKDSQRSSCIAISPFCHVLVGAICHVFVFVMFWLAPFVMFLFLSCSGWRQIYHYQSWYSCAHVHTFLVTMFGDPSADVPKNMA
jgi:hypothetical protein